VNSDNLQMQISNIRTPLLTNPNRDLKLTAGGAGGLFTYAVLEIVRSLCK